MNGKILGLGVMAACGITAFAKPLVEDRAHKTFSVSEAGTLTINADRGSIDVKTGSGNTVEIDVVRTVEGGTEAKAQKLLQEHTLSFDQNGNNVTVKGTLPQNWKNHTWFSRDPQLNVHYVVTVPKTFSADLRTSGGNISTTDLGGDGHYRTSGGSINVGHALGPVFARTSGGDVRVNSSKKSVDVETSGGSIRVGDVDGDVHARTSGGNIELARVTGTADIHTSGGSIKADEVFNTIKASTSGGNVTAHLAKQPTGECNFKTSGGNIEIALAEPVAVDIDARTSGGSVQVNFPVTVQGKRKDDSLKTKVNGGGPLLTMQTSGGNVHIRKM